MDKMLKRAAPGLQAAYVGNQNMFDDLYKFATEMFDDMAMFYNIGKRHRQSRKSRISRTIFMTSHSELQSNESSSLPAHIYATMIDMFYTAYCDGYNGVKR